MSEQRRKVSEPEIIPIDWEKYPNVDRRRALLLAGWVMEHEARPDGSLYRLRTHSKALLELLGHIVPTPGNELREAGIRVAKSIVKEEEDSRRKWVTITIAFEPDFVWAKDATESELVESARKRLIAGYPTVMDWPVTVVYQGDKYGR